MSARVGVLFLVLLLMPATTLFGQSTTSKSVPDAQVRNSQIDQWKQEGKNGAISQIQVSDKNAIDKAFFVGSAVMENGFNNMRLIINALLVVLITLDLCGLGIMFIIQGADLQKELAGKMFNYSLWGMLIVFYLPMMNFFRWLCINLGLVAAGVGATGLGAQVTAGPTAMLMQATIFASPALDLVVHPPMTNLGLGISFPDLGVMTMAIICYLMILIPLIKIVVQYAVVYLKFSALIGIAGVLLPLGVFGATKDYGTKALNAVYAHGIELMMFTFLYSVGSALFQAVAFVPDLRGSNNTFEALLGMVVVAFLISMLIGEAGHMAQAIAAGTVSNTDVDKLASNVMKTAMMGAAAAAALRDAGGQGAGAFAGGFAAAAPKGGLGWGVLGGLAGVARAAGGSLAASGATILKATITRASGGTVKFGGKPDADAKAKDESKANPGPAETEPAVKSEGEPTATGAATQAGAPGTPENSESPMAVKLAPTDGDRDKAMMDFAAGARPVDSAEQRQEDIKKMAYFNYLSRGGEAASSGDDRSDYEAAEAAYSAGERPDMNAVIERMAEQNAMTREAAGPQESGGHAPAVGANQRVGDVVRGLAIDGLKAAGKFVFGDSLSDGYRKGQAMGTKTGAVATAVGASGIFARSKNAVESHSNKQEMVKAWRAAGESVSSPKLKAALDDLKKRFEAKSAVGGE